MSLRHNSSHSRSAHQQNERLVREFLQAAHGVQINSLDAYVAEQVKCWGFPEFGFGTIAKLLELRWIKKYSAYL